MDPLAQTTGRFTKAGESEIDRRSTAVMAHAQLKGALETLCPTPDALKDEMDVIDPKALADLGMTPEHAIGLYRALYKYSQKCVESHDRVRAAMAPVGPEAKQDVLDGVWSIFTTSWEAAAGAAFPSKVAGVTKALDSVDRLAAALSQLQTECADRMRETDEARAESARLTEEVMTLRPFPGRFEECTKRAEGAESERDDLKTRVEELERKLAFAEGEIPKGWEAEKAAVAAGEARANELTAAAKTAADAAAANVEKMKNDHADEVQELMDQLWKARNEAGAAIEAEKDMRAITGTLKADIAFHRESKAGATEKMVKAIERAEAAEGEMQRLQGIADRATAACDEAELKADANEKFAKKESSRAANATARLVITVSQLLRAKKRIGALESTSEKQALSQALNRADSAEEERDQMKHRADAADEKSKEQKERINELETQVIQAQTAQKAAETKQAELQAAADELTAAKTKLEEDLATARQETADAVQALEDYKKEFLVEQKARLKAEANMREMRDENRRVITQVVDGEMEKLVTKVDGVGAKAKEGLEKQDKSWDGLNAGVGEFVDEQSAKMDAVKKEFKVWSDDISELTDKCAKKTQEAVEELIKTRKKMRKQEQQLKEAKEELGNVKTELAVANRELKEAKKDLAETKSDLETATGRVASLEEQFTFASNELEATKSTLTEIEAQLKKERSDRLALQFQNQAQKALAEKRQKKLTDAERDLEEAQDELESAKKAASSANASSAVAKMRVGVMKEKLESKLDAAAEGGGGGGGGSGGGIDPTKPFLDPAKILEGTPDELMPYQQQLADEYVEASLALKAAGTGGQ